MKILDDIYLVGSDDIGLSKGDCNIYLLDCGNELVLIDAGAGMDIESLFLNIQNEGFDINRLKYIFLTHAHADHAGGAAELKKRLGCTIIASPGEATLVEEGNEDDLGLTLGKRTGSPPVDYTFVHCQVQRLKDNEEITIGNKTIRAIQIPGHSVESSCYLLNLHGKKILFSGDTVFYYGLIGLLNCPGCDLDKYRKNLPKLAGLGIDALLPGHMLFTVANGQEHINRALYHLSLIRVPPFIGLFRLS